MTYVRRKTLLLLPKTTPVAWKASNRNLVLLGKQSFRFRVKTDVSEANLHLSSQTDVLSDTH
jgi:hypothetical protein